MLNALYLDKETDHLGFVKNLIILNLDTNNIFKISSKEMIDAIINNRINIKDVIVGRDGRITVLPQSKQKKQIASKIIKEHKKLNRNSRDTREVTYGCITYKSLKSFCEANNFSYSTLLTIKSKEILTNQEVVNKFMRKKK